MILHEMVDKNCKAPPSTSIRAFDHPAKYSQALGTETTSQ